MTLRICNICNVEKELEKDFYGSKYKDHINYNKTCKKCRNQKYKKTQQAYRKKNVEKVRENERRYRQEKRLTDATYVDKVNTKQRERYPKYVKKRLLDRANARAKKNNLFFNLEITDIVIPEYCPILEVKLVQGVKGNYEHTPSLDRIDNTRGYIKGNVAVISNLANTMKNKASLYQLTIFSKNILNYMYNK